MYYVYAYLDPRKPGNFVYEDLVFNFEPFYIGKGSGKRKLSHVLESHIKRSNGSPKIAKIRKLQANNLEPIIVETKTFDNEIDAYQEEIRTIRLIGSDFILGIKDGPLTNLVLDGTIPPNHKSKTYLDIYKTPERAEEQRKKRHEKQLAVGGFFKGQVHNISSKMKIGEKSKEGQKNGGYRTGIAHDQKTKTKMRLRKLLEANSRHNKYSISNPNGEIFYTAKFGRFCAYFGLSKSTLEIAFVKKRIPNRGKTKNWSIQSMVKLKPCEFFLRRFIYFKN